MSNENDGLAEDPADAERMREVLRSMAAGVVLVDAEGRIEYANAAAAALYGLKPEDVVGQLIADPAWQLIDEHGALLDYDALPVPTALRERREVRGVELGLPTLTGEVRWMRVSAVPVFNADGALRGAVVTTEDVTERYILAEQLLQAQKLEGIGQLAGGVAHDFNNLLTVMVGNAELALLSLPVDSPAAADVAAIRDAAQRGGALTQQMLTFARGQVVHPREVRLDLLTADIETLLRHTLGEHMVLRRASDPDLWPVKVDPVQMEQVVVNMTINARDAMRRGGVLTIETRNAAVDAQLADTYPDVEPGDFVRLSIGDSGSGMSSDVVAKIFDPFFTTKPVGRGTGIGLSICHGVVKQAHGFISVDTAPGRGTTFHIHLPRACRETVESPVPIERPAYTGKGTILLVEDNGAVRTFVARALTGYGYEVVSAASAREALDLCERSGASVGLLLTDIVMPEMDGVELAAVLQARDPELPVLYMTGHFDEGSVSVAGLNPEVNLLLKPFTPMRLAERVEHLIAPAARENTDRLA